MLAAKMSGLPAPGKKVEPIAGIARALGRPAWQRTLSLHSERLGVTVTDIR